MELGRRRDRSAALCAIEPLREQRERPLLAGDRDRGPAVAGEASATGRSSAHSSYVADRPVRRLRRWPAGPAVADRAGSASPRAAAGGSRCAIVKRSPAVHAGSIMSRGHGHAPARDRASPRRRAAGPRSAARSIRLLERGRAGRRSPRTRARRPPDWRRESPSYRTGRAAGGRCSRDLPSSWKSTSDGGRGRRQARHGRRGSTRSPRTTAMSPRTRSYATGCGSAARWAASSASTSRPAADASRAASVRNALPSHGFAGRSGRLDDGSRFRPRFGHGFLGRRWRRLS